MDRIFLDANILYSASYLENSGLSRLWKLENVELLSSAYTIEEARRNLALYRPSALGRFKRFAPALTAVNPPPSLNLPVSVPLYPKDRPILLAAIHGKANYLLTGDARHFEHLYGKRIEGVLVLRPAQYFERRRRA